MLCKNFPLRWRPLWLGPCRWLLWSQFSRGEK